MPARAPSSAVSVEILYVDGCPGYAELRPRLERLLAERDLLGTLVLTHVMTSEQAEVRGFLGSPTVRVAGRDVESEAAGRPDFGLKCRLYGRGARRAHAPTDEMISGALQQLS